MLLPVGIHYYCFIVDGELKCASNLQWACNHYGDHYNILYLQVALWSFFSTFWLLLIYKSLQYFLHVMNNITWGKTQTLSLYIINIVSWFTSVTIAMDSIFCWSLVASLFLAKNIMCYPYIMLLHIEMLMLYIAFAHTDETISSLFVP